MQRSKILPHIQYRKRLLDRSQLSNDPWQQFSHWFEEAEIEESEPLAFSLSTCSLEAQPSARMVHMKSYGDEGLFFFTHYDSRKGKELSANPRAVALFYWPLLERQVTIEGRVEPLEEEISQEYFASRPLESQIATQISRQGKPIASREVLLEAYRYGLEKSHSQVLQAPAWWGGYKLIPARFEFWQGREHRLHDRFEFTAKRKIEEKEVGEKQSLGWQIQRLSP